MEAAGLEESGISFFTAFFSALLGIVLFVVLIAKAMLQMAFGLKFTVNKKASSSLKTTELNMSVS